MEEVVLSNGKKMPLLGHGVFQVDKSDTYRCVKEALEVGYRLIDTAAGYGNEEEVGQAIKDSGIQREEIFVTSKLWLQDYGYEAAKKAINKSLEKLGLDYIDLYLIHQPYGDVVGAWKAMEEAKREGKIRSIGVSNMTPKIWNEFIPQFKTIPSVNQVEFNPYFQQRELRKILAEHDVALEAWGPFGQGNKSLMNEPIFTKLAEKYHKDNGQIIARWIIQEGIITFPRSVKPDRIKSNFDVFDFELTGEEMDDIRKLDKTHGTHNPDAPGVGEFLIHAFDVHKDEK